MLEAKSPSDLDVPAEQQPETARTAGEPLIQAERLRRIDVEFEKYQLMRASLRRESGKWRRSAILQMNN